MVSMARLRGFHVLARWRILTRRRGTGQTLLPPLRRAAWFLRRYMERTLTSCYARCKRVISICDMRERLETGPILANNGFPGLRAYWAGRAVSPVRNSQDGVNLVRYVMPCARCAAAHPTELAQAQEDCLEWVALGSPAGTTSWVEHRQVKSHGLVPGRAESRRVTAEARRQARQHRGAQKAGCGYMRGACQSAAHVDAGVLPQPGLASLRSIGRGWKSASAAANFSVPSRTVCPSGGELGHEAGHCHVPAARHLLL
jgi:hypothetical protein